MARPKLTEAKLILRSIDSAHVGALYEFFKNKKVVEPIFALLDGIKNRDAKKIIDSAGGVSSMDSMINNSSEQSFRRGRISFSVLFRALVINAEEEMVKREGREK